MTPDRPKSMGRYQLLALLATGGMAEIYLARQTGIQGFERLVVVKRILPHLAGDENFVEMFFDEARIAAQLNHPNIVQIFDLGQEGTEFFIAMEYLEGESLGYLVSESRRVETSIPAELAASIVARVCDGLDYAHKLRDERGAPVHIVHRDVSPHNIIVLFSGGVKLVDFGIAKATSQAHHTQVGTLKGKLNYMSPEQCLGLPVTPRSDIFALGVVFWEILAHRRLFKRDSEAAVINAIVDEPIPPIHKVRDDVPRELEAIAMKAVQRDPAARYQSTGAMAASIREYLRQSGAAADTAEIAAFVGKVFAERARTKQRLLDEIRNKRDGEISLRVLKPDTSESFPSRSKLSAPERKKDYFFGLDWFDDEKKGKRRVFPAIPRKYRFVSLLLAGLVLVGGTTLWLAGVGSGKPRTPAIERNAGDLPPGDSASAGNLGTAEETFGGGSCETDSPNACPSSPAAGSNAVEPRSAILAVNSVPAGCRLDVDGVEVPGSTPVDALAVEADSDHIVTVNCPGREPEMKRITATASQKTVLNFAPRPIRTQTTPAGTSKQYGTLRLDTIPWSEIYFGKRRLGLTPLLGTKLPPGFFALTAINPERGLKKTINVTIQPGKTTTLRVTIEP